MANPVIYSMGDVTIKTGTSGAWKTILVWTVPSACDVSFDSLSIQNNGTSGAPLRWRLVELSSAPTGLQTAIGTLANTTKRTADPRSNYTPSLSVLVGNSTGANTDDNTGVSVIWEGSQPQPGPAIEKNIRTQMEAGGVYALQVAQPAGTATDVAATIAVKE